MIFNEIEKGSILARISFLESELKDLNELRNTDWKTYREDKIVRKTVERTIENIVNALIDISKIILSDKAAGEIPSNYSQVVLKLSALKLVEFELAEQLAECVKLRNFLAHQYLDLRWDKIKKFLQQAPDLFPLFIQSVKNTLKD